MAQETAAFEGLQYSSQYQPYDFGKIATGIADITEKRRLEAERRAKELDAKQMQLIKDYGEVYSTFDKTGLDNFDQLGLDTKNLILERAEDITGRLNRGEITGAQASKEMMLIKNQSVKVSGYITGLKTYADEIRAKGDNASPSDLLKLSRIDSMIQDGVSVAMDANSNLMFLSEEDGKLIPSPFSKLSGYQTFSNNIQPESIMDEIMKNSKLNEYYDKKGEVVFKSALNKDNTLTDNQVNGITESVNALDGPDLYDAIINAGIDAKEVEYQLNGDLTISNEKEAREKLIENLKQKAVFKYGNQQKDEPEAYKLGLMGRREARQAAGGASKKPITKPVKTPTGTLYPIEAKPQGSGVDAIELGGNAYTNVVFNTYEKRNDGTAVITFSHGGGGDALSTESVMGDAKTETLVIRDIKDKAYIENLLDLDISKLSSEPQATGGASRFNKG